MTPLADALSRLGDALAEVVTAASADDGLRAAADHEVLEVLSAAGRIQRYAEAVAVEASGQIIERDDARAQPDRLTSRHGCRNVTELIQRATRTSGRAATGMVVAAKAVHQRTSLSTGEVLPADFPALRDAASRR